MNRAALDQFNFIRDGAREAEERVQKAKNELKEAKEELRDAIRAMMSMDLNQSALPFPVDDDIEDDEDEEDMEDEDEEELEEAA